MNDTTKSPLNNHPSLELVQKEINAIADSATELNAPGKVVMLAKISGYLKEALDREAFSKASQHFVPAIKKSIEEMKIEHGRLKSEVDAYQSVQGEEERLKREGADLKRKKEELDVLVRLKQEIGTLEKELFQQTAPQLEEEILAAFQARCVSLAMDYNDRVAKIAAIKSDLELLDGQHAGVMEAFRKHLFEDEAIYGVLKSRGEEGVLSYAARLGKNVQQLLDNYDKEIRELISKREQLPLFEQYEMRIYQ